MSELKRCPFCGGEVELQYYEIDEPFTFTECGYEICCCHCDIRFKERLSRMPQFDEKADIKRQNLIERWNRRVSDGVGSNEADRPQGEWIRTGRTNIYGGIEVQCSNCGDRVMVQHLEDEWYCRHCGADMGMKGADDECVL